MCRSPRRPSAFYRSGPPLLQRYMPFWLANLVDRMWVALVSIIAVLIPLSRMVPPLYEFRIRSRMFRWYAQLREVEEAHGGRPTGRRAAARARRLEQRVGRDPGAAVVRRRALCAAQPHPDGAAAGADDAADAGRRMNPGSRRYSIRHHLRNLKRALIAEYHLRRDSSEMVPPKALDFVGGADFEQAGEEFKDYFIRHAGLQPDSRVLDVGCGIGRMAIPLTSLLSSRGGYWGFDIVRTGIKWCQARITPRYPNFHFEHTDVNNDMTTSVVRCSPATTASTTAPASTSCSDLGVHAHAAAGPAELPVGDRQGGEAGGRVLITFFILNAESRRRIDVGASTRNINHPWDGCMVEDPRHPEGAVGTTRRSLRTLCSRRATCSMREPILYGSWCGRERFLSYQDIVVADRVAQA